MVQLMDHISGAIHLRIRQSAPAGTANRTTLGPFRCHDKIAAWPHAVRRQAASLLGDSFEHTSALSCHFNAQLQLRVM